MPQDKRNRQSRQRNINLSRLFDRRNGFPEFPRSPLKKESLHWNHYSFMIAMSPPMTVSRLPAACVARLRRFQPQRFSAIALMTLALLLGGQGLAGGDRAIAEEDEIDYVDVLLEKKRCRDCDLRYRNLEGLDLEGVDLRRANLYGANLQRVNLAGADLRHANLGATDLRGADLSNTAMKRASLEGAQMNAVNLENADLRHANFYLTDLTDARLVRVNLRGARWQKVKADSADFCGATMPNGTLFRRPCFDPQQTPDEIPQ